MTRPLYSTDGISKRRILPITETQMKQILTTTNSTETHMTKLTAENAMKLTKAQLVAIMMEASGMPPAITPEMKKSTKKPKAAKKTKKAPKVKKTLIAWDENFSLEGKDEGTDYMILNGKGVLEGQFISIKGNEEMDGFFALYQKIDNVWTLQSTHWRFYQVTRRAWSLSNAA